MDASRHDRSVLLGEDGQHGAELDEVLVERAAGEIDGSLLDWYRELSMTERLRAASRQAAVLERLARAASSDR